MAHAMTALTAMMACFAHPLSTVTLPFALTMGPFRARWFGTAGFDGADQHGGGKQGGGKQQYGFFGVHGLYLSCGFEAK
ncbi:hypothetical protein GCM10022394_35080 [Zobellella aerophila]|uniref:Secreted protein n=1 Tax=Zobellella aerophila TaxID=870480 RepID=A0ABP6WK08_9GAMM